MCSNNTKGLYQRNNTKLFKEDELFIKYAKQSPAEMIMSQEKWLIGSISYRDGQYVTISKHHKMHKKSVLYSFNPSKILQLNIPLFTNIPNFLLHKIDIYY